MKSDDTITKCLNGYKTFQAKYHAGDQSTMAMLAEHGQQPRVMVVSCCDSRVDPGIIMQCDPGELFVVRNVGNIIPPFENDELHHGTSAALEFAICYLGIKHLIILGHSQCGGLHAYLNQETLHQDDFITHWVSLASKNSSNCKDRKSMSDTDTFAKYSLNRSYQNCLTFPWIKQRLQDNQLQIHQWFFSIKEAQLYAHCNEQADFMPIEQVLSF